MTNTLIRKVSQYLNVNPLKSGGDEHGRREPSLLADLGGSTIEAPSRNPYVNSQVLVHFQHAFDAEELWRSARSQSGLRGGLRALIDAHPHLGDRRLPTSIVLELPEELIEHDNRIGGNSTETLLAGLAELYLKDNKERLKGGELPRFMAVSAGDLPPHQIRVRMGAAIHVPAAEDRPAWRVQTSLDGTIWPEHTTHLIPSGQRLWILGGSQHHASTVCPEWPFEPETGIAMVSRPDNPELLVSSQPLKALNIAFDAKLGCHVITRAQRRSGVASVGRTSATGAEPGAEALLYLRTERLLPVALDCLPSRDNASPATMCQTRPVAAGAVDAATDPAAVSRGASGTQQEERHRVDRFIPSSEAPSGATQRPPGQVAPVSTTVDAAMPASNLDAALTLVALAKTLQEGSMQGLNCGATLLAQPGAAPLATLTLEGIALQRPSNFVSHGVKGLQFGISAQGSVVPADSALRALRFDVSQADEVRVTTAAGTRSLSVGDTLPLARGQQHLQLSGLPHELASFYIGWLRLPLGQPVTLARGQVLGVGRQLEALRPIQPLAGPGFLTQVPELAGDQMGLSRRHFELRALAGDQASHMLLEVRPLAANTVVALDEDMRYVATATADRPVKLLPGHCLVVGHYVWRYSEPGANPASDRVSPARDASCAI